MSLVAALGDLVTSSKEEFGELTVEVAPGNILAALKRLKGDLKFERLTSVTGVDRFPTEPRFEVVYHLQSIANLNMSLNCTVKRILNQVLHLTSR